jgi:hypothetical protein
VLASGALGLLTLGLLGVPSAHAAGTKSTTTATASPTPVPSPTFQTGRHVYDLGNFLSTTEANTDEALASKIEASGGGRVVIYTVDSNSDMPDVNKLSESWNIDGLLLTTSSDFGTLNLGSTLKGKLTEGQVSSLDTSPGPQTTQSWIGSTLARAAAFASKGHIFDGAGVLDAAARQQAEGAATTLSSKIGAPVYVDISLGGEDSSSSAFFNSADLSSSLDNALIIALSVSGTEISGYLQTDNADIWDKYNAVTPWSSTSFDHQSATDGNVQATLLSDIAAVHEGSAFGGSITGGDFLPVAIFVVVIVVLSIAMPFLIGPWLIRKLTGTSAPLSNGIPSEAVIESIADTGVTITMPGVGPEAPEYKLGLQVTPRYGAAVPYLVETKVIVPRIFVPMITPGRKIGVFIDPTDQMKVQVDFSRFNGDDAAASSTAAGTAASGTAADGLGFNFDANGQPESGDISALMSSVSAGTMPMIKGSADHLLATGTHGTAVITTAMPMGKTVKDINPAADPSRLNDPMWLFTLEVSLAGEKPFPAVFGHRVPAAKIASIGPGVKLAVAVDMTNRNQDVAIDWDKSPIG